MQLRRLIPIFSLCAIIFGSISIGLNLNPRSVDAAPTALPDIVFIARSHLATPDDIFSDELGPAGQFGTGIPKFAPGSKLMIRHSNGSLTTLVNGSNPISATGYLIDVQSPDVSFDGTKIIFAGATTVDPDSSQYGWRLYEINVNGTGFHKLNIDDRTFTSVPNNNPNHYDFGNYDTYHWWNDLFPAYLADGRIVFSSSRYPARSHYDDRHTYNLYMVNADGSNIHRISSERGSLLHPTPLPDGRILVARWWNNFNQPSDKGIFNRIDNKPTNQVLPDGTLIYSNTDETFNPSTGRLALGYELRGAPNTWHIMSLYPDGTHFQRYAFTPYADWALTEDSGEDTYVGAQPAVIMSGTQQFIAFTSQQDSSMVHSTQRTGIRVARPNVSMMYSNTADAIAGLTYAKAWGDGDDSPPYAIHPWQLASDGSILFSYAAGPIGGLLSTGMYNDRITNQQFDLQGSDLQYQLYTMKINGSSKTSIATSIGNADAMDAKPIVIRSGWATITDTVASNPNDDPRYGNVPNTLPQYSFSQVTPTQILTATIHNPNVYANAPLTLPFINNSPMPGTIAFAQVYIDANQFTGAYCYGPGYPNPCTTFKSDSEVRAVLWTQVPVSLKGEFTVTVPADTPGFIVLRDANGRAVSGWNRGYVSIAQGSAWARPGETVTCIGCHLGHVSGSIDSVKTEVTQGWTNVAPYASVTASSYYTDTYDEFVPSKVNDRRGWVPVPIGSAGMYQDNETGWMSEEGKAIGEGITLTWPSLMTITKVRLVGPPPIDGDWGGFGHYDYTSPYHIVSSTLQFYLNDVQVNAMIGVGQIEPLTNGGTVITLPQPIAINRLKFTVKDIEGKWWWSDIAALNEIEVIGMAAEQYTINIQRAYLPLMMK
jgi:hypothetical protein